MTTTPYTTNRITAVCDTIADAIGDATAAAYTRGFVAGVLADEVTAAQLGELIDTPDGTCTAMADLLHAVGALVDAIADLKTRLARAEADRDTLKELWQAASARADEAEAQLLAFS